MDATEQNESINQSINRKDVHLDLASSSRSQRCLCKYACLTSHVLRADLFERQSANVLFLSSDAKSFHTVGANKWKLHGPKRAVQYGTITGKSTDKTK